MLWVKGVHVKNFGDGFWDPVGPPAVAVDEAGEACNLGAKPGIGA